VGVFLAGVEFDAIHCGSAAYLVVSLGLPELSSMLAGEDHLTDSAFFHTKRVCHTDPEIASEMLKQLMRVISDVKHRFAAPSGQAGDFLERSIIEPFVTALVSALPEEGGRSFYTGSRLVSETEDYTDAADGRPVHISEICSALKVSRRSLHRAFANTLGIGPVAYMRRRRLSAIRSVLRRTDPAATSIGDVAFEYGFSEPSRFAAYYRSHFGEKPSDTSRSG
jgi:AraC family ethanolamine operon transcriptional activator